ncbi:MAG TPA: glycosyltransferase [Myxococcota bacterium]|nr:glycosyltransferase [Myxococcota bacterium]
MILYVLRYFPTLTETFAHDELRGVAAAGVPVALAAFGSRADPGTEPLGHPVYHPPHRWGWLPWLPALLLEWFRSPGYVLPRVLWLAVLLRRLQVQRVHVHFAGEAAEWAAAAAARVGLPVGITVHAVDLFKPRPGLGRLLAQAHPLVTISAYNQAWIDRVYGRKAALVPCGVRLREPKVRAPATPPVFLSAGRWVPKKGFPILMDAMVGLPATLELYSDLPPLPPPPPSVVPKGLRPRAELHAAMDRATAFVLPCVVAPDGDQDGIPVVILEAMAAGLPVVTTAVSGIPELVDNEVGWLLPPGDVEALRAALWEVLKNPEEAAERGRRGRARVEQQGRSLQAQVHGMLELWGRP